MLFVRPSKLSDLDQIERMARSRGPILHSLPPDRQRLQELVSHSIHSLRADADYPGEEGYLFVLEDSDTGRLHGTAGIVAIAGFSEPFYAFRNDVVVHASPELRVNRRIHVLAMSHELTGRSRLTGFYLDSEAFTLAEHVPDLLSRARLMFAAQHRQRFTDAIFTVLPGVADENGHSPFWEGVGRKFFGRDFTQMEIASGGRGRTFIAEMMPADPLYVPLLSGEAQRVMGEPHPDARVPYRCHVDEGLEPDRFVDIFDAGPVLTAALDLCHSVRHSELFVALRGDAAGDADELLPYMVSNTLTEDFRAVIVRLPARLYAEVVLPQAAADVLEIADGDEVRCVRLNNGRARP
ncbi:arginine N-succinyltransferase [Crenobacter cavernae]|uniref:Arginine/ornithine succinyltransferase subunit alpha n=1 Tax=Crenobacter cavernae TaxID=2290923 RepID=A0A345Y2S3_9NEIS|nr:arginine N-succinyltransferase [Crenobacter cavernae]AXK38225.1 arginine/ornithine succinyltransferase subunit alpha [Crenobacter cavernae]